MNTIDIEKSAKELIEAWESLPEGHHKPQVIQRWLVDEMGPAVAQLRKVCAPIQKKKSKNKL